LKNQSELFFAGKSQSGLPAKFRQGKARQGKARQGKTLTILQVK